MHTVDLARAADFLKMHPEEVRRRAKAGLIRAFKPGKRWVFFVTDLAEYIKSSYSPPRQALRVTPTKELEECHFASVVQPGGSTYALRAENEYAALLGLATKP